MKRLITCWAWCSMLLFTVAPGSVIGAPRAAIAADVQDGIVVRGRITSPDGEVLPGSNVVIKGTSQGTMADAEGNYTLTVPDKNTVLVFSFVGYLSEEVVVGDQEVINIALNPSLETLSEIVVMGYQTVKKSDVTGAVSSFGTDRLMRIPANDIRAALIGVPGVRVSGNDIRVRGTRSVRAGNDPLIILDGMPYYGGLNTIDPTDIASVDVLKDASSTSLYGAQGANGVIVITTKQGKEGKTVVSYDMFTGIGKANYHTYDPMNADQYVAMKREAYRAAGTWSSVEDDPKIFLGTELANLGKVDADWVGEYFERPTHWTSHTVTVSSGTPTTQYKIQLNARNNDARFDGAYSNQYYVNMNLDHQVAKFMKVGLAARLYYSREKAKPDPLPLLLQMSPLIPIYNEDGSLNNDMGDPIVKNPFATESNDVYDERRESWRAFLKGYALFDITKGLTFRTNFSYNPGFYAMGQYYDQRWWGYNDARNWVSTQNNRNADYMWNNVLNYKKTFGKHAIDVLGVYEIQNVEAINNSASARDQVLAGYKWFNMGALSDSKTLGSAFTRTQMISYVGRAHYSYNDRYMATVTFRQDGASQLSKDQRWDFFPSFALAWRASEETFVQENVPVISDLKLRASYGVSGNRSIGAYATRGALNVSFVTFNTESGEVHYPGLEPGIRPTPDLTWEKTKSLDFGIDFGLFDNRITGTIDYYKSKTSDLLNERKLPYTSGFDKAWENVGRTQNTGLEIALNAVAVDKGSFRWTVGATYYRNKEEMIELYDPRLDKDINNGWWIGQPVSGVRFDYKQAGIWQTDEADVAAIYGQKPGEVKVVDMNGDAKIDGDDRVIIGNGRPKWMGSIQSTINWKNFDFTFDMYAEIGALTFDSYKATTWPGQVGRWNTVNVDYWTPENPTNRSPRPVAGQTMRYMSATAYHSNDYIDLRNITVGYTVNNALLKNAISKLRVYATVNAPFRYWDYWREDGIQFNETQYIMGLNFQL
ncbi:SusC/RagA family TonB-linked outer membrane protein [Dawidia soli]|uniref:TonB-dependent receptor n=1 Tax=Dawidia soli TaxID=2782352 RepID=A0AAP2D6B8_9BACT|nr:TonB-dependent receptor [Dawidia soli]MBT1685874.1 TonB-dependent receptor [Dawidia soli]